jgi:hypothetical protein
MKNSLDFNAVSLDKESENNQNFLEINSQSSILRDSKERRNNFLETIIEDS